MDEVEFLRSQRTLSQEDVDRIERLRDRERGLYVPHGGEVHHYQEESRH